MSESESFAAFRNRIVAHNEKVLESLLPAASAFPARLHDAMRYSVLGGGKRVRPLLTYAAGTALGVHESLLDRAAAALELIHAYSLVHDDLPAMDNDDLRRGRPTCHKAYDEATAILVGDALLTQAFRVLAEPAGLAPRQQLRMVAILAQAAGSQGMVGGQAVDLAAVGHQLAQPALEQMHLLKTGMLIRCAIQLALVAADVAEDSRRGQALIHFADRVGLAFQVQDDILDEIGDIKETGKAKQGADRERQKPGFVTLLGLSQAQEYARSLLQAALDALAGWGQEADHLRALARLIVERNR
ncbi:farnesyl diphosphate synthase [Candidatus Igneacidithiobacillus taiwanensis]|uniref:polyprenyl synthetase family protein n=1 Tax=Candidatus Igneacidithiobacillus taiwanensis TaxID=1945924 RepID=UPI00289DD288|nr:farnesyl diphosphate synthase [Candidatus Igneacidithiobacillus taiwanensis]MCE5360915.1 polyprenyl synthetase family protein [Acidithiobacillus sp.]